MAAITIALALIPGLISREELATLNIGAPIAYSAVCMSAAAALLRRSRLLAMTPLFAFYAATTVYFGIGSLAPFLASDSTLAYLSAFGDLRPETLAKFNLTVALGTLSVMAMTRLGWRQPLYAFSERATTKTRSTLLIAVGLYVIGFLITFSLVIPDALGLTEDRVPGAVGQLANCTFVGIFLLALWALDNRRELVLIPIALTGFEMAVGLFLLAKQNVLLPLVGLALAFIVRSRSWLGLAAPALLLWLAFSASAPIVDYGRQRSLADYGSLVGASFEQRIGYVADYFRDTNHLARNDDLQYAWVRLSYVTWGIKVIELRDLGQPGDSLRDAMYAFIPRAFWPDKPQTALVGGELYERVTGNTGVFVSSGLYAEAYWNYGWPGVVGLMSLYGFFLSWLSRVSVGVLATGNWLMLPVVFYGIRMGTRPDGLFISDVIGAGVLVMAMYVLASLLSSVLKGGATSNPLRARGK